MSYTFKNSSSQDKEVFDYYFNGLEHFLEKNSVGRLFDFVESISKKYKQQNSLIPYGHIKIDTNQIGGKDERIDITLFYIGLVTFLRNITEKPPVRAENIEDEVKEFTPLPLEAFNYKGHNKIDIKESKSAYALLYE